MLSIWFYAVNEENNNSTIYDAKNSKPVIVVKDSNLQLSESSPPLSIDIVDTVNKKKGWKIRTATDFKRINWNFIGCWFYNWNNIRYRTFSYCRNIRNRYVGKREIIYNETKKKEQQRIR